MTDDQIQEMVNRMARAVESLQPVSETDPGFWDRLWDSVTFAPLATLVVGILAAVVAGSALWQKSRSDARAEWWRRTQWALDNIPDGPEPDTESATNRETLAYAVLGVQVNSKLAKKIDVDVIEAIVPFMPTGEDEDVNAMVETVQGLPELPSEVRQQLGNLSSDAGTAPPVPEAAVDAAPDSGDTGEARRETHERQH